MTLGKASCFVLYVHWRNYVLCLCNVSPSSHMVNKCTISLSPSCLQTWAYSSGITLYDEWLQHICHLFTNIQTWNLYYCEANGIFSKWNMFYVYETKYYCDDTEQVGIKVTPQTCIWDVPGLNLSWGTSLPDQGLRGFSSSSSRHILE
jgi:hypothetical protein